MIKKKDGRRPTKPSPIPLGGLGSSGSGSGSVVPDPPMEMIIGAIETLRKEGQPESVVKEALKVLQVVIWKHKGASGRWVELDKDSKVVQELESAWKVSLTLAGLSGGKHVCRLCELETSRHPYCSSDGKLHPTLSIPEYSQYKRTYTLPGKVKELLSGEYLPDLVEILRQNQNHLEALVFAMMVMTETTSPKLAVDANKSELLKAGAIPVLLDTIKRYQHIEVIAQDGCAVFRNLLTNIPTNTLFEQIKGTVHLIHCIDKYPMNSELVHRACGCLLILASRGVESRRNLFDLGIVKTLVRVLETPHGREHTIRRLIVTAFQKLIKSIPKQQFCEQMEEAKGFTIINTLYNSTKDDDRMGMAEVLSLRGDLPRGTFVDPLVMVIDEKDDKHIESIVQMMKANEMREYIEDPPTPKLSPQDWSASSVASPLFPSPPSFGAADFDDDDGSDPASYINEFPMRTTSIATKVQKARTPGAPKAPQSSQTDVAIADDDLSVYTSASSNITTPGTKLQMETDAVFLSHAGPAVKLMNTARKTIEFLDSSFTPNGTFIRTPDYAQKLYNFIDSLVGPVTDILRPLPKCVDMNAPVYVFGDIHGNFGDLKYFMDHLLVFKDLAYTPHSFLFVGDYVDRGRWGPEVMAYLLALKVLAPSDVVLLRGNHEDVEVNGDVDLYGDGSFRKQMLMCFSPSMGHSVANTLFDKINSCFKHFPIAAIIENKVFATHGGIPRFSGGEDNRMETLRDPNFAAFDDFILPVPHEINMDDKRTRQHVYAHDCIWSDPSTRGERLDEYGFGRSSRGGQVVSYGQLAIHNFLDSTGMEFIIRGHEEKADGLNISKQARVLTVFSTSDYCRKGNKAGVALVRKLQNGDLVCRMIHRAKPAGVLSAY